MQIKWPRWIASRLSGSHYTGTTKSGFTLLSQSNTEYPTTWAFLTSTYALSLVVLAIIINRINHVAPPRNPLFQTSRRLRIAIRLPALLLLVRAALQVTAALDLALPRFADSLLARYQHTPAADILWACFVAMATSALCESFNRAVDHDFSSTNSLNLISFSLLLHFHSTPSFKPKVPPGFHIYLIILFALCETLSLQIAAVFQTRAKLIITALFSLADQTLFFYIVRKASKAPASIEVAMPGLQYVSRMPEICFTLLALLTIIIRALTQLVVEKRLSIAIFGHRSAWPSMNMDFSFAVMRFGALALETTALNGFANQVDAINEPQSFVELSRGLLSTAPAMVHGIPGKLSGFGNEIKDIRVTHMDKLAQETDSMSRSPTFRREAIRLLKAFWQLGRLSFRALLGKTLKACGLQHHIVKNTRFGRMLRWLGLAFESRQSDFRRRPSAIARELEDIFDEDQDDSDYSDSPSESSDSENDAEEVEDDERLAVTGEVFADTLTSRKQDLPLVLAHLNSNSPITRRTYETQYSSGEYRLARRKPENFQGRWADEEDGQTRSATCIVCASTPRSVVLWPCKCLAMCEECRSELAGRTAGSGHLCPCCRTKVSGYSRIWIP